MALLLLGLLLFVAVHVVPTRPALRDQAVARLGEGGYKGLFSLVSAAGLIAIVLGYKAASGGRVLDVWYPPTGLRHATYLLMLPVFPLLVAAYLPGRIKTFVPNPMLLAVKLWAMAHLLAKGTAPAMLLFGSLLAWAVYDLISVKGRQRAGVVKVATGPARNDVVAVAVGLALYLLMSVAGHAWLIGVQVLPPGLAPLVPRWLGG
jgi:uncharacterized membrane protein